MTEPFVVEVWGKAAGIVLWEGQSFRFHAIAPPFLVLDGVEFTTLGHARLAAARLDVRRGRDPDIDHSLATGRSLGRASHLASNCPL